jgi:small subunit ribosomal protein S35
LEAVAELVMKRAFSRKHDQSDEELMDELQMDVVEDVHDSEFESDFEEAYETDHEVENLYNATEYTEEKLLDDGHVEMDAETYDEVVKEMQEKGHVIDQQSLEELVEDMTNWDKLLPGMLFLICLYWICICHCYFVCHWFTGEVHLL